MKINSLLTGDINHWGKEQFQKELLKHTEFHKFLYSRGFLITTDKSVRLDTFPFLGQWNEANYGNYRFLTHSNKKLTVIEDEFKTFFMIGHAYNPFSMGKDEKNILQKMSNGDFWCETDELTGVYCCGYIENEEIFFTSDATGQQLIYYGVINGAVYITSHSALVAGLCNLVQSKYISKLCRYKYFRAFGLVLPGDLSPYSQLTRAQCNFYTKCSVGGSEIRRFWPRQAISETKDYEDTIREIGNIIHNNMQLITEKWPNQRSAISVTGGMDSKTTMACTEGLYDKFKYFSYVSLLDEQVDAIAAENLCKELGLEHIRYEITDSSKSDFQLFNEIMYYNMGCIGNCNSNDVRKRLYFTKQKDFDVEVKSWVDEIGRARYHKRFAKNELPRKVSPRILSTLYKPFLYNRMQLLKTDKIFRNYLKKYYTDQVFQQIPWWDILYWEFEWNAAEGAFLTGEHLIAYDITIPFNNRKILELMLSVPLEKRINDMIQKDVIHKMNSKIEETGIHVQDISHTDKRAKLERMYFEINTRIPL